MAEPPFTMSKYASEKDLLADKAAWLEARLRQYGGHEATCAAHAHEVNPFCNCGWERVQTFLPK